MSLLRTTAALFAFSLTATLIAPAAADQVFSSVSTGPVQARSTPAPYPLGDIYYAPCGWYGNYGGSYGSGRGGRSGRGDTTLTGERFYPYDISSNGNRTYSHGRNNGRSGYGCNGARPSPRPGRPLPAPYATPRG